MSDHSGPHISPLSTYFKVYGALLVLTLVTVGLSVWFVPAFNIDSKTSLVIAMIVASCKAFLVCAWFMHLKWDKKFNVLVFGSSVWFVSLFFIFTTLDLGSRGDILEITNNFEFRQDEALKKGYTIGQKWEVTGGHGAEGDHGAKAGDHGDKAGDHGAKAGDHGDKAGDHGDKAGDKAGDHGAKAEGGHAEAAAVADAGAAADDFDEKQAFESVCGICHGAAGAGDGVVGASLVPKPANFTDPAFWTAERTDEQMHKAIKEGGVAVGKSAMMAGYGAQYSDEQITQLVEHLKTFKPAE